MVVYLSRGARWPSRNWWSPYWHSCLELLVCISYMITFIYLIDIYTVYTYMYVDLCVKYMLCRSGYSIEWHGWSKAGHDRGTAHIQGTLTPTAKWLLYIYTPCTVCYAYIIPLYRLSRTPKHVRSMALPWTVPDPSNPLSVVLNWEVYTSVTLHALRQKYVVIITLSSNLVRWLH